MGSGEVVPLRAVCVAAPNSILAVKEWMHVQIQNEAAWQGAPRYVLTGTWTPPFPALAGCDCGCSGECGLGALGAATLTAEAAMQAAIQASGSLKLNPKDFQNSAWLSKAALQIRAGAFDISWYSGNCGSTPANMSLFTTAAGISISAAGATEGILVATHVLAATTGAILGAATMGVGVLVSVISMIFAHHAAAVKRDLAFGCGALPAVNNAFSLINQAVQSKQTTPEAAAQALDAIYTQYQSAGGAAINDNPWCNSNCEMGVILKAMVLYWQAQYAAMAASSSATASRSSAADTQAQVQQLQQQAQQLQQQAATATANGDTATAAALTTQANVLQQQAAQVAQAAPASGTPSWVWLLGAGAAAFFLFK